MSEEQRKRSSNPGLCLKALDLHVHTPASHDFDDKTLALEEVVKAAIAAQLDGIAITDHNTVAAIDAVKEIAKQYSLTIFPGFEISCHGAERGPIHVIGIFDPSTSQSDLERVLGKLDVKKTGKDSLTTKSVSDVVNIIRDSAGLPILAHANSTHGALTDIRGNPRLELVQNPNLLAIEATHSDFLKPAGSRLIDYLNGKDPNYRRKIAVFCGSDNPAMGGTGHSAATIGYRYTYFKMGAPTLESLRQCFEDPDTRIIQYGDFEKYDSQQPRILEVTIEGGFLDAQAVVFHAGMNSIIGGTGTGKSLLIEFLRFVFNRPPHPNLKREYLSKLEKQLGDKGVLRARFVDRSNEEYEVNRTYMARKPNESPTVCVNRTTGHKYEGEIASIFPVLFYSQNEILEVTRDPKAQLDLLDNFRDFEGYKRELETIVSELRKLDRQFATSYEMAQSLSSLEKQLKTLDEKIEKCGTQIKTQAKKEFGAFDELDVRRTNAIERQGFLEDLSNILQDTHDEVEAKSKDIPGGHDIADSPEKEVVSHIHDGYDKVLGFLQKSLSVVGSARTRSSGAIKLWENTNKYRATKAAYDKSVRVEAKLAQVETERQKYVGERDDVKRTINDVRVAHRTVKEVRTRRLELLTQLQALRSRYFAEREEQAKLITNRSSNKLSIQVRKQTDHQKFTDNLLKLKIRSYAEEKEIEAIASKFSVVDFIELVLDHDVKTLAKGADLTEQKAGNIIDVLLQADVLPSTLALQHTSFPDDQIEILYRKQDGSYHGIAEISMGQKADALLMIALGDSHMPVVIDQPEDALDVSSIWDDICQRLRTSKHSRQFIFTTHNSSVAVAADSDQFIIMEAAADRGWVSESGSIDEPKIKDQVVEHLEGGPESYNLKRRKYGEMPAPHHKS